MCQKVICALKPRSDERARDIFARTVASNAAQKLRFRKRVYNYFFLLRKLSFYHKGLFVWTEI